MSGKSKRRAKSNRRVQGKAKKYGPARTSHHSTNSSSRPTAAVPSARDSRAKTFFLVSLATIGTIADVAGMVSGPPLLKFILGGAAAAAGISLIFLRKKISKSIPTPTIAGAAVVVVGLIAIGLAFNDVADREQSRQRSALLETCATAQDYKQASGAADTHLAASGKRDDEWKKDDQRTGEALQKLVEVANRSENLEARRLAEVMQGAKAAAFGYQSVDAGKYQAEMIRFWENYGALANLCRQVGLTLDTNPQWTIEPSTKKACGYLGQVIVIVKSTANKNSSGAVDPKDHEETDALGTMFFYNAIHSPDDSFRAVMEKYLQLTSVNEDAAIRLVRDECVSRGFAMPAL
jgi:hypothetical protein